jgi:hypothetical protein
MEHFHHWNPRGVSLSPCSAILQPSALEKSLHLSNLEFLYKIGIEPPSPPLLLKRIKRDISTQSLTASCTSGHLSSQLWTLCSSTWLATWLPDRLGFGHEKPLALRIVQLCPSEAILVGAVLKSLEISLVTLAWLGTASVGLEH